MKLTYRPEIDGLRAIAVGAVILYHAQITIFGHQLFKGGFIGVDIFFVISGYLITSIILKELVTTGSFSFKNFYERRIRRILPALLFVMLVSLPFAYVILLPNNLIDFSKSLLYSLGFSSNFYFHYTGQEYGAADGLLKPFLHTWSLSVEEQYYILFPIVLLFTFKYLRKYLIHILILGFVVSLGLAEWTSRNYLSISFYFFHTRVWELLAGSILAYLEITNGHRSQNKSLNFILPFVGLILIGHSTLFFNDSMFHPSFYTLSPIIGACLIIWFSSKNELITKILSTKLFVGIGLISYSLYLWHYPIFSFYRNYSMGHGLNLFVNPHYEKILTILLLIVLSISTYFLIEKIFRLRNLSLKNLFQFIFLNIFLILIFIIFSLKTDGFEFRIPKNLNKNITSDNVYTKLYRDCFARFDYRTMDFCQQKDFKKNINLVGDSRSSFLLNDLKVKANRNKYNLNYLKGRLNFRNTNLQKLVYSKLIEINDSIIIINGVYNQPGYEYIFLDKIENFIKLFKILEKNNNKVIFIQPIPVIHNPYRISHGSMRLFKMIKDDNITVKTDKKNFYKSLRHYIDFKKTITKKFNNIYFLKTEDIFCDIDFCYAIKDNNFLISDDIHQSALVSGIINDLIMKEIEKIEFKSN
jgi:peptidoglycan/LPS O-acetylase OafA/YrhL